MTEWKALITALFVFEAANRFLLDGRKRSPAVQAAGFLLLAAVTACGWFVFGGQAPFLSCLAGLLLANVIRLRLGLLSAGDVGVEPWRYVPAAAVWALSGSIAATVGAVLLLSLSRRVLRAALLFFSHRGPFRISSLDVDTIVPPPVRYARETPERGMTLLEVILGLTLLTVISSAFFVASMQRSARLRQTREKAAVRETAVSVLERVSAVPFENLGDCDGTTFPLTDGDEPGRIRVTFPEAGLARIEVEAPRRGSTPVRLTTLRSGGRR